MKITLSLCKRPYSSAPALIAATWGVAGALIVLSAYFAKDTVMLNAGIREKENRLQVLDKQQSELKTIENIPSLEQINEARRRIAKIDEQIGGGKWSTVSIMTWFESNMHDKIYLGQFMHDVDRNELRLVAYAPTTMEFSELLNRMEGSEWYKDAIINRREMSGRSSSHIQYEMQVTLR